MFIFPEVWSAGGGAGGGATACGSSGMDLKHEVAYRGVLPGQVKAEPGVHNGQVNGHVRDWMAGGAGANSPSPGAVAQPQPNNGYSSPLSSGSYGPYSPNGKIGEFYKNFLIFHFSSFTYKSVELIVEFWFSVPHSRRRIRLFSPVIGIDLSWYELSVLIN